MSNVRYPPKGYITLDEAVKQLRAMGFKPIPGASPWYLASKGPANRAGLTFVGRINDGPGSGDTFFLTIEETDRGMLRLYGLT